ncbi:MAG: eight-cysteine-cluster domain-containing protein [Thermodesulfovibrionales bacterium]|nr:eight-cysteine-cluster domain-containing protein [Thermodesulfovibrionales bacterium]
MKPNHIIAIIYIIASILFLSIYSYASEKPETFQPEGFQISLQYKNGFCGWATGGECKSDSDCIKGGCSGQVCQSQKEAPVITTCEWRECYNANKYTVSCRCVENRCEWGKKE